MGIENPLILFFAGMVVTCSLEYFVSWLLETLFHKRWWDYTGWPGNINGRVCLIGGIAFGTFTVALIKLIAPVTIDMIDSVSLPALHIMTCVIAFVMIADTVKTVKCMDSSKLWYVEKQAEFMNELRNGRCVGLVKKINGAFLLRFLCAKNQQLNNRIQLLIIFLKNQIIVLPFLSR